MKKYISSSFATASHETNLLDWVGRPNGKLLGSKSWCANSEPNRFPVQPDLVGGEQGGQSLPLPVPRSPASRTFVPLCLPTLTLHGVAPIFRLIKKIRSPGLTFKLCQNLTLLFIFWPLFWRGDHWFRWKLLQVSFLNYAKFHWPGYHSLTIASDISL